MLNLKNIATGWGRSMGWLEIDEETAELSKARLNICATCPLAKESSILKLFKGEARDLDAIYCSGCGCPVNEKSLVKEETCPENKW